MRERARARSLKYSDYQDAMEFTKSNGRWSIDGWCARWDLVTKDGKYISRDGSVEE